MRRLSMLLLGVVVASSPCSAQQLDMDTILDFRTRQDVPVRIVNDGVMGGRSSSSLEFDEEGFAVFQGALSLENNGGFASVRMLVEPGALDGASHLVVRVRGDGRRYQLRLRPGRRYDGVSWAAGFDTDAEEWVTATLPVADFEPTFRGYRPRGAGPLDPADVGQLGIMLADKQEGPFRLEIEWVGMRMGTEDAGADDRGAPPTGPKGSTDG